eukprot:scaffold35688_cov62-Phaeocystis_antarctica.AAC.3
MRLAVKSSSSYTVADAVPCTVHIAIRVISSQPIMFVAPLSVSMHEGGEGGKEGGSGSEGGSGGEGGHAVIMLLRPANWNRRFPTEVVQPAQARVGSFGLSPPSPWVVASNVPRSFLLGLGSNGSRNTPPGTASSVLSSSAYRVKPEAVSLSLPPLSSWFFRASRSKNEK